MGFGAGYFLEDAEEGDAGVEVTGAEICDGDGVGREFVKGVA